MSGALRAQEQRNKQNQDRKKEIVNAGLKSLGKAKNNFPTDVEIESF